MTLIRWEPFRELDDVFARYSPFFGRLAAAYRATGEAPYDTLGLPWHTGLAADHAPLAPDTEALLSFALTPVSRVIPAGHRLRLVITGADPRQRNLADIRIDPPPRISLTLGGRSGARTRRSC